MTVKNQNFKSESTTYFDQKLCPPAPHSKGFITDPRFQVPDSVIKDAPVTDTF